MKMLYQVILMVAMTNSQGVMAQETGLPIPSLNYWKMSSEMLANDSILEKLKVTASQRKAVNAIRGGERFTKLFMDGRRTLRFPGSETNGNEQNDQLYMHFDLIVRRALSEALDEDQLKNLKAACISARFPHGLDPFASDEILDLITFNDKREEDRYLICLEKVTSDYARDLARLRTLAATNVVGEFPPESKVKLVQLIGNKYLPAIPDVPIALYATIPFRDDIMIYGIRRMMAESISGPRLGLSSDQLAKIGVISQQITVIMLDRQNKFPDLQLRRNHAADFSRKEIFQVLTNEQLVRFAQADTLAQFEVSSPAIISNKKVQEFLLLSKLDASQLESVAIKEQKSLIASRAALDRKVFEEICDSLPAETAVKMRTWFKDVW